MIDPDATIVPRFVECETCRYEYVYLQASSFAAKTAKVRAKDDLVCQLAELSARGDIQHNPRLEHEVVPCPQCGTIQPGMIRRARELHMGWMRVAAYLTLAITGIMCLPLVLATIYAMAEFRLWAPITYQDCCIAFAGFSGFVVLLTWRNCRADNFDPNSGPAGKRVRLGQMLAVGKEEFLWNQSNRNGRGIAPEPSCDQRFTAERHRERIRSAVGPVRQRRRIERNRDQ
jgi:hypothetical protein